MYCIGLHEFKLLKTPRYHHSNNSQLILHLHDQYHSHTHIILLTCPNNSSSCPCVTGRSLVQIEVCDQRNLWLKILQK